MTHAAAPMPSTPLPAALRARLAEIFGERLKTAAADCLPYGYDNSRRVALPQAVAFALAHDEVAACAAACHEHGTVLIARGRGTNTTGATVPITPTAKSTIVRIHQNSSMVNAG